jgi:hypothetical protein
MERPALQTGERHSSLRSQSAGSLLAGPSQPLEGTGIRRLSPESVALQTTHIGAEETRNRSSHTGC